ncbi:nuclear transport factor 2-like [Diadema setosum]|uniref:nuclear transport factor 2-like n=1 Tax=Diadema setosum TaxID=31175 RepID=UPI003B3B235F
MDPRAIATQFVQHYYNTFDSNRANLKTLYMADSRLSFEGQEFVGPDAIVSKLESLPFKAVQHVITTVDSHVSGQSLLVSVLGQLKTDDDPPHSFFQTFVLVQSGETLVVLNDIFRLVIHNV